MKTDSAQTDTRQVEIWDFHGTKVDVKPKKLDWTTASAEKSGYRHFMLKEIHEQPAVMRKTCETLIEGERPQHSLIGSDSLNLSRIQRVHIIGCGTAYLAGLVVSYELERILKLPVVVELASEFRYRQPFINEHTLVIAMTQSGETADTLACVKYAKEKAVKFILFAMQYASIPMMCTFHFTNAGWARDCVASTKLTAMVLDLYLLGLSLGENSYLDSQQLSRAIACVACTNKLEQALALKIALKNST